MVLCFAHLVADFISQPRWMAEQKSSSKPILALHCLGIFLVTTGIYVAVLGWSKGLAMSAINTLTHFVIDWNIWNGYKFIVGRRLKKRTEQFILAAKLDKDKTFDNAFQYRIRKFKENKSYAEDHWFYCFIGIDQTLHMTMYILTLMIGLNL
jgi:hypothetical protein